MAAFCGFVSFCNAREKQQVFMQTVKCVFVCGCVRVVVYVCVCVRLCERERERIFTRYSLHKHKCFRFCFFFSRGKGRGLSLVSSAASSTSYNGRQFVIIIYSIHAADPSEKWSLWLHGYGKFDMLKSVRVCWLPSQLVKSDHCHWTLPLWRAGRPIYLNS